MDMAETQHGYADISKFIGCLAKVELKHMHEVPVSLLEYTLFPTISKLKIIYIKAISLS